MKEAVKVEIEKEFYDTIDMGSSNYTITISIKDELFCGEIKGMAIIFNESLCFMLDDELEEKLEAIGIDPCEIRDALEDGVNEIETFIKVGE